MMASSRLNLRCWITGALPPSVLLCVLLSILFPPVAQGTLFLPIPIRNQLDEAYGVIQGMYMGKIYKLVSTKDVVTVATFKVIRSAGIKRSEMVNNNEFSVLYPGGVWQGVEFAVYGSPTFTENEEVVLFLKKNTDGFWVENLSLGKYKVVREKSGPVLVSSVFPRHPRIGRISFRDFEELVFRRFGEKMDIKKSDKMVFTGRVLNEDEQGVATKEAKGGRELASKVRSQDGRGEAQEEGEENFSPFMAIFLLASVVSLVFKRISKGRQKS